LGVGPGDEVLVPEVTWVATASAVTYTGAKPVLVDIDPATWCMDPDRVRQAITPRTKAIMPVHLYGHPTDMKAICQLADEHGLHVLEDAAPALGAEIEGRKVGSFGHVAAFSFQGAKIMTCGEGGMLVTSDQGLYERAKYLNDHGRDPVRPFVISAIGYKYKMSNLQAALGLAQLERIEEMIAKRRLIFQWYRLRLGGVSELALNVERFWARNIYWMTSIVLGEGVSMSRDDVIAGLKARDIDSRPFFPPVSSFPMFESCAERNPVAYEVSRCGINLPSGHNLNEADVDRVCASLLDVLGLSRQHREAA
jgi:perosamine synthetase